MEYLQKMDWFLYFGYAAVLSSVITSYMKTMIPLRAVSIICNSFFIIYALAGHVYPTLFLNLILLPLNAWRLREMIQLTRRIATAVRGDRSFEWLKPFMVRRTVQAGDVLFRKGDEADALYYPISGLFRLAQTGIEIAPGQIVGELALLAPDKKRTQTLECLEAGEVLVASYNQVRQIYFQNPEFGFHFLQVTSARLFQNIARLEDELTACKAKAAGA